MKGNTKRKKSNKSSSKPATSSTHTSSSLIRLPLETFLEICKSLTPVDLLSLSLVCKTFYNDLCCGESKTIQEIWRQSRLTFMPFREMDPPEGMNEREYIRFLIENKCYFCGSKTRVTRIYWERRVRSCIKCFKENTILEGIDNRIKLILQRPFLQNGSLSNRFWRDQVESKYAELCNVDVKDQNEWIYEQYQLYNILQREIAERRREDVLSRENQRSQRIQGISDKLDLMCEEIDENGWKILRQKLIKEYPQVEQSYKSLMFDNSYEDEIDYDSDEVEIDDSDDDSKLFFSSGSYRCMIQ
ncbi:12104_t:CDS:2 [Dentiscutata heterogama]|uniref:12104_t:CDS:1 n=1 Tax=Dentiscutata heterogama TaxID=1316150 RepID=A0ACA9JVY8_9GLOM|nr:12104_t:CDS:2 [Dentiscutata heterogama]